MPNNIFKTGTQIVYIPGHAGGKIDHPDCEFGFITSVVGNICYCRFWTKKGSAVLRTKSNSEAVRYDYLVCFDIENQSFVDDLIDELYGTTFWGLGLTPESLCEWKTYKI